VANWFAVDGGTGLGPLTVPAPVPGRPDGRTPQAWKGRLGTQQVGGPAVLDTYDPYADDPIGRDLSLPPRMDVSRPADGVLGRSSPR
jgi:hypothetical protein